MNDQMAKMKVLQQIIDLFSDQQLSGLKKKGAKPDMMEISVDAGKAPEGSLEEEKGESPSEEKAEDDESPDLLQKLAELYGEEDDDKKPA